MSARRFVLVAVACLYLLAASSLLGAPVAFAEACPNEAARSGPSASLPDCRAYEMVTPADKSGIVQDMAFDSVSFSEAAIPAVDGNRVALDTGIEGLGPTPQPSESFVMFTRTASGWQTDSVNPPDSDGTAYLGGAGYSVFTPDLSQVALISADGFFPTSPDEIFQAGPPGGPFTAMATAPLSTGTGSERRQVLGELRGATPDFSSIFIDSPDHTLAGASTGTNEGAEPSQTAQDIYRWEDGKLSVVDQTSEGLPVSLCGAEFKAVSEDGSKVFFRAADNGEYPYREPSCPQQAGRLYMRVGDSNPVEISDGYSQVEFRGASADGSKVFFTTTSGALYEYDTVTSTYTAIAHASYVLPSRDGSRVYFETNEQLTPNAPAARDIYRYNTETGETHYIANFAVDEDNEFHAGEELEGDQAMTFRVTPNGKFLIFYATNGGGGDEDTYQVYRYDDENEQLTCVSCLPSGAPMDKASEFGGSWFKTPSLYTWDSTPPYTVISNDGSYVFFESTVQLVPQAVNATGGKIGGAARNLEGFIADVYEWHNGVVSLISSPNDQFSQHLLGASEDGSNVFFVSHARLVPQDIDSSGDIYDARIDGGFPLSTESTACEGDTCVITPPALNDPTPGSSLFSGPGNPPPVIVTRTSKTKPRAKACGKGRVFKKGKCVRKPKAKKAAGGSVKHDRGGSK
jgi:hypothetical protein